MIKLFLIFFFVISHTYIVGKEFLAISDTMKPFIVKRVKHLSIATLTNEDTCMYYREFFSSPGSWKTAMP